MKIAINEVFASVQGEGRFTGHPAIFIRMQGCEGKCEFCDTKHSWTQRPETQIPIENLHTFCINKDAEEWGICGVDEVVEYVNELVSMSNDNTALQTELIVITGGEPFAQAEALYHLIEKLHTRPENGSDDRGILIETSGTVDPKSNKWIGKVFDISDTYFLSVSPKGRLGGTYLKYIIEADQVKMLVGHDESHDIPIPEAVLELHGNSRTEHIVFQPIWTSNTNHNTMATDRCIDMAHKYGGVVGLQAHKFMGVR